jgi:hypothetical protein
MVVIELSAVMPDDLAREYVEFAKSRSDDQEWAWVEVERIVRGVDSEAAWTLVMSLVEAATGDKQVLGLIGAGPLEDLLRLHPARLLDRAENEAKRNPAFAEALRVARYPGHEL